MLTFTLTEQQADLVLAALQQRPHFEVNGLINVLLQQAQQQQAQQQQAQTGNAQMGQVLGGAGHAARQIDAAESNRIGVSTDAGQQAANGLDQHA